MVISGGKEKETLKSGLLSYVVEATPSFQAQETKKSESCTSNILDFLQREIQKDSKQVLKYNIFTATQQLSNTACLLTCLMLAPPIRSQLAVSLFRYPRTPLQSTLVAYLEA